MGKIYLIGAGISHSDECIKKLSETIKDLDVITGHKHYLDLFPEFKGEKLEFEDSSLLLSFLKNCKKDVAVISSGDPGFFGISRFLLRNLPKDRVEIVPNISSMQYAFAKIKEPWDDAIFISAQEQGLQITLDKIVSSFKTCVLTDKINTPQKIAEALLELKAEGYQVWLCEELGSKNEKFIKTDVKSLLNIEYKEKNLLIFIKVYETNLDRFPLVGICDAEFSTSKKLLTRQEVRAVTST